MGDIISAQPCLERYGTYCAGVIVPPALRQQSYLPEHRVVVIARDRHVGTTLADDFESSGFSAEGPLAGSDGASAVLAHVRAALPVVVVIAENDAAVALDVSAAVVHVPGVEVVVVGDFPLPEALAGLFDSGVADVMASSCSPVEANARVRRCLARAARDTTPVLEVGAFAIDVASRAVVRDGHPLRLTRTEFDLLLAMARRPGRVIAAAELLRGALGYVSGDTHGLTVHIQRLRAKVEPDPANPVHIKSVRGVGYLFTGG